MIPEETSWKVTEGPKHGDPFKATCFVPPSPQSFSSSSSSSSNTFSLFQHQPPMKLININPKNLKLSPKRLFRSSKKDRSAPSRSDPPSFGSSASSSEGSTHKSAAAAGSATPTSVLPDASGDWSIELHLELSQAFRLIDRDGDGVVSRQELEAVLKSLAPLRSEEVAAMLREVDAEGRGCISVEELVSRVGSVGDVPMTEEDELREAFEVFDSDGDGRISAEELLRVFHAIGDERCTLEECRRMIEGVDRNRDGFVCFEDFSRMMELQQQQR
ncbi:hypothetical protein HN51_015137 [Arachis hypogaea]|uniref:EF-hand domain-containing protein n=2 Tax=Arachis TaxID=3817 RepID=A0A445CLY4_ARAHY|nr:probable calcium-binding protein CML35 [Arachis duranensis]QHO44849.1 putative calcium-binding protein [Arachis hypogaea]RYR51912.1 hypothetical protein Ahy_A06g026857 [Arachis hypogaea]